MAAGCEAQDQGEYRLTADDLMRLARIHFLYAATLVCISSVYRVASDNLRLCFAALLIGLAVAVGVERLILGPDRACRKAIQRAFRDTDRIGAFFIGYFGAMVAYLLFTIPFGLWMHGPSVGHMDMLAIASSLLAQGLFALRLRRTVQVDTD